MSGPADALLSRLDKVKVTGPNRWVACCPAHADKSPSLAIRELADGRILIRCFAGCLTSDVLAAIGLEFSDLFPDRLPNYFYRSERRPWPASDILRCIAYESLIVESAVSDIHRRGWLSETDENRLYLACVRIQQAASIGLGEHAHG